MKEIEIIMKGHEISTSKMSKVLRFPKMLNCKEPNKWKDSYKNYVFILQKNYKKIVGKESEFCYLPAKNTIILQVSE